MTFGTARALDTILINPTSFLSSSAACSVENSVGHLTEVSYGWYDNPHISEAKQPPTYLGTNSYIQQNRYHLINPTIRLDIILRTASEASNSWVRFRCKLSESKGYPEVLEMAAKSDNVIDFTTCRIGKSSSSLLSITFFLDKSSLGH